MPKKKRYMQQSDRMDHEVRNAFRLIKRAASLVGDEIQGDLNDLPIIITYHIDELTVPPTQLDTHFQVVQHAINLLVTLGFSLDAALHILFHTKATREVFRDMHAKHPG